MEDIWVLIQGRNHQEGRAIAYAHTREELLLFLQEKGYSKTEWENLFESDNGYWIHAELLRPAGDLGSEP